MKRKMVALVIGNAAYGSGGALKNPVHDAEDIAAKLKAYGFDVITVTSAKWTTCRTMLTAGSSAPPINTIPSSGLLTVLPVSFTPWCVSSL